MIMIHSGLQLTLLSLCFLLSSYLNIIELKKTHLISKYQVCDIYSSIYIDIITTHQLLSCSYCINRVSKMSIEYLLVVISKIPKFLNFISLQDICNIRQSCSNLKIEIDKKLTITIDNEDIEVTCQDNHHKKKIIRESTRDSYYTIVNPFCNNTIFDRVRSYPCHSSISITITEDECDRIIRSVQKIIYRNNEEKKIRVTLKRVDNTCYRGRSNTSTLEYDMYYIMVDGEVIYVMIDNNLLLRVNYKNRLILYNIITSQFYGEMNLLEDEGYRLHNAVKVVLSMMF